MGLDTFASHSPEDIDLTDEDLQAFGEADIELCGGIFSGGGNDGSFRGKIYALMILDITGISLYQEWIPPETVTAMYKALLTCDPQGDYGFSNSPPDVVELRKFFKVCSDRGLGLINWS